MRMMMKVKMDTEAASGLIADGSMPELMQAHLKRLQPEAAFFGPENGVRTGFFVFDLKDPSDLPRLSEPLFSRFGATIEMFPVMNQEDLQKGLQKLEEEDDALLRAANELGIDLSPGSLRAAPKKGRKQKKA